MPRARIAERGEVAAVRNRQHHIRINWVLLCKLHPEVQSNLIDILAHDNAVRPREVDVLKDAECAAGVLWEDLHAAGDPILNDDYLSGFHLAKWGRDRKSTSLNS